jgi:putative FmdB family regulatory protein
MTAGYDYICVKCGEKFRVKTDIDTAKVKCPLCGSENPEKIVYASDRTGDSCSKRSYG